MSIILNTDSYKVSHWLQFPKDTEYTSYYIESRGGEFEKTLYFGLQMFVKEYLLKPITQKDIDEGDKFWTTHGEPFNREGWEYILNVHNGYLPLEIKALEEGTVIPVKNVLVQVTNTDSKCYWLPGYIEKALLRAIWYPTTVATYSYYCKKIISEFLELTGCSKEGLEFKLHDFGGRGVSSYESAGIGGLAHLLNFKGTDTSEALIWGRKYYNCDMAGYSIPAAEHSTITSWGKEFETEAYRNMLTKFKDSPIFAVVTDSYDHFNTIRHLFGNVLYKEVINHKGVIVFRPDSGIPEEIVPQTIKALMDKFGYKHTKRGHLILPSNIRVIQGDKVSIETIHSILYAMHRENLAADNVSFGMGGNLLQKTNRDIQKFAMKMSAIRIGEEWRDVFKDPITDPGKKSKKGRLVVIKKEDNYKTIKLKDLNNRENCLKTVYKNGNLLIDESLDLIRDRIN